ncbi:hypothetical protein [Gimesia sp.]|uniref:hypothetical protein n=1 Tax=Gimesia sp. TaxID=2024833 RepID=UPI003A946B4F
MSKVKYVLLLPVNYNDGSEVPEQVRNEILDQIYILAGGYRVDGEGEGAYRMQNGTKQVDRSIAVWIVVDEDDIPELKNLAGEIAAKLEQETIYLEHTGSTVEFIPPFKLEG